MKITEVRVSVLKNNEKSSLAGFANITIDDELVIKGIKIVNGRNGLFISMPATKGNDDQYYDDVFPITVECWEYLNETILAEYESAAGIKKSKKR